MLISDDFEINNFLSQTRVAYSIESEVREFIQLVGSSDSGKKLIRMKETIASKKLVEEALPISIFCSNFFKKSEEVFINFNTDSKSYDAVINDYRANATKLRFIEVTQAHEGQADYFRRLNLHRYGHVTAYGNIEKSKETNLFSCDDNAVLHSDLFAAELKKIEKSIIKKSLKKPPSETILVIAADDYLVFKNKDELESLEFLLEKLKNQISNYAALAIVGWSGSLIYKSIND